MEHVEINHTSRTPMPCSVHRFKKDPAPGFTKQCVCNMNTAVPIPRINFCSELFGECSCKKRAIFASLDSVLNKQSIQSYITKDIEED